MGVPLVATILHCLYICHLEMLHVAMLHSVNDDHHSDHQLYYAVSKSLLKYDIPFLCIHCCHHCSMIVEGSTQSRSHFTVSV